MAGDPRRSPSRAPSGGQRGSDPTGSRRRRRSRRRGQAVRGRAESVPGVLRARSACEEDVTDEATETPSGEGVIADERDTLRRESLATDLEEPQADRFRHPRQHPVRKDVVEHPPALVDVPQVAGPESDIPEAEVCHAPPPGFDLPNGEVDADEGCLGQAVRNADEVVAARAAQLEDPCRRNGRRLEPAKPGRPGDPLRVGEAVDEPFVGEGLVALPRRVGVLHTGSFSPAGPAPAPAPSRT